MKLVDRGKSLKGGCGLSDRENLGILGTKAKVKLWQEWLGLGGLARTIAEEQAELSSCVCVPIFHIFIDTCTHVHTYTQQC